MGVRGATLNLGKHGARATVGLPGTGLSYTTPLTGPTPDSGGDGAPGSATRGGGAGWVVAGLLAAIMVAVGLSRTGAPPSSAPHAVVTIPTAPTVLMTVTARTLNCRAGPAAATPMVRRLTRGTPVSVGERSGVWIRVLWTDAPCWVLGRYLN